MLEKYTGLLLLLLTLSPPSTQASTVEPLASHELSARSELIFQGRVISSQAVQHPAGHISTYLTFAVDEVMKGAYSAEVLELEFLGGTAQGRIMQVGGLRIPGLGDSGTFYVETLSASLINPLLGWSQDAPVAGPIAPQPQVLRRSHALLHEGERGLASGVPQASAYRLSGNYWPNGTARIYIGMPGTSTSGSSWRQGLQDALDQWSKQTAFEFQPVDEFRDPCTGNGAGTSGGYVSAGFSTTVCGQAFGSKVLAVTMMTGTCLRNDCSSGFAIDTAAVVFNSNEAWDIYTGPRRTGRTDFGRVALHELGHAIGLAHENLRAAIMQPNVTDNFALQADDISAANAIYGPAAVRDDQSTNLLPSIYGIDVVLPPGSELSALPQEFSLNGALEGSDGMLNGRHIDLFQYTLSQDAPVDIRLESGQFDALLYLVRMDTTQRPVSAETFTDDNSGGNPDARLTKFLPAGTYWIGASTALPGGRGAYTLKVSTGYGTPGTFASYVSKYGIPVQVNPNPFIAGALDSNDGRYLGKPIDLYEFTTRELVTLQIDLGSAALDTALYLARVLPNQELDGASFFHDNDGGGGTDARLVRTLQPGTYWIGASSAASDAAGPYRISISVLP